MTGQHAGYISIRSRVGTVDTREAVDTFYAAALNAGATPREAPGIHTQYHDDYYGEFVNDPQGINLEAVCHHPQNR